MCTFAARKNHLVMALTLTIFIVTCTVMILGVLFFPKIRLGRLQLGSYWVVAMAGAIIMLCSRQVSSKTVLEAILRDDAINPLKILVLFISMTILSIYLDELGFFRYLANLIVLPELDDDARRELTEYLLRSARSGIQSDSPQGRVEYLRRVCEVLEGLSPR